MGGQRSLAEGTQKCGPTTDLQSLLLQTNSFNCLSQCGINATKIT